MKKSKIESRRPPYFYTPENNGRPQVYQREQCAPLHPFARRLLGALRLRRPHRQDREQGRRALRHGRDQGDDWQAVALHRR